MGFKKPTISRNEIGGHFEHNDIQSGEVSVNALRSRMDARQEAINKAHRNDWPADMLTASKEDGNPIMANAMSRQPRPSDAVVGSANRYGAGQEAPPKKGGPPQKPAAAPGVQPASKSRA